MSPAKKTAGTKPAKKSPARVPPVPPQRPQAGRDTEVIDLDREVVLDGRGRRITEADAERIAEQTLARVGRPSLTGAGQRSPAVSFRVSIRTRQLAEQRAAAEGKTVSQIAREALERYIAKSGPA